MRALRSFLSIPARLLVTHPTTVRLHSARPPSLPRTNGAQRKRPSASVQQENVEQLSTPAVVQALRQCADARDRRRGEVLHRRVVARLEHDPDILRALISFYMKCGDVETAQTLFDSTRHKPLVLCGVMMKGYLDNGTPQKTIDFFRKCEQPNAPMHVLFFQACMRVPETIATTLVTDVAAHLPEDLSSNPRVVTVLIGVLMKCGVAQQAEALFAQQTTKDLHMFGTMMKGYVDLKMPQKALELFHQIEHPDVVIYVLFFKACAQLQTGHVGELVKCVSARIPRQLYSNPYLLTSWANALMKTGDMKRAQSLFDQAKNKTMELHGAMMEGFVHNQVPEKAIELFHSIKNPTDVICIALFKACARVGTAKALELIKKVLSEVSESYYTNGRFCASLIDALMMCGDVRQAEAIFNQNQTTHLSSIGAMMKGFTTNLIPQRAIDLYRQVIAESVGKGTTEESHSVIHLLALNALAHIGIEPLCNITLQHIPHQYLQHATIKNALIHMWGKVNRVDKAKEVFDSISQVDKFQYATMINAYGLNGRGAEAIKLFQQVPPLLIEETTYVCVLNACSHAGHVQEARVIFSSMPTASKTVKIYGAMVDCLSRAGLFAEAQRLVDQYEVHSAPSTHMYMALLSGARNEKNSQVAEVVYHRMKALFPKHTQQSVSATVLLANVYASAGQAEKSSDLRAELHRTGLRKEVGLTSTFVDGQFVQFRAHDQSHPRRDEIYAEAAKIAHEIEQHGHEYDASWVTRPLAADETVASVLCGHSERLAIAFNFVVNPHTSVIYLAKNLRICQDCHRATKLIAAIRRCRIIARDGNRMHVFGTDGRCSCNDYF